MALLDRERNVIVMRVVYDGPPHAGKTTSLRALSGSLGQSLYSPAEDEGRTLYFDWMDYTGGRFEGMQLRCQIVSVPGQRELDGRRRHLLRSADVVVFVGDTTRPQLDQTLERLAALPETLRALPAPSVGVILQANKRDCADAVPLGELRARVTSLGLPLGIVESVAQDGTGIRETFVFAVRLALDRVREQVRTQTLGEGRPDVDSGVELLRQMKQADAERGTVPLLPTVPRAAPLLATVLAEEAGPEPGDAGALDEFAPWRDRAAVVEHDRRVAPRAPDATAPSGAIWPPVEGRLILHEAAATLTAPHRLRNGSFAAGLGAGWRAYSAADAVYADLEVGRERLIRWARLHAACAGLLSSSRCIVLAATGPGKDSWRLWQIVRSERSLRDQLDDIEGYPTDEAAARLVETAAQLCDLSARLDGLCAAPCSLDTVGPGLTEGSALYIGFMPMERPPAPTSMSLFGSELQSILGNALSDRRDAVLAAMVRPPRLAPTGPGAVRLDELLGQMRQRPPVALAR